MPTLPPVSGEVMTLPVAQLASPQCSTFRSRFGLLSRYEMTGLPNASNVIDVYSPTCPAVSGDVMLLPAVQFALPQCSTFKSEPVVA